MLVMGKIQGVQEKLCFHSSLQPLPLLHIAVKDLLNAMRVYSISYWLAFFVQPTAAECYRGGGFENPWEKTQYHPENFIFNQIRLLSRIAFPYMITKTRLYNIIFFLLYIFIWFTGCDLDFDMIVEYLKKPIGPVIGLCCQFLGLA